MSYLYLKAFHIIAFTSWMAGMFYLPRLFAYHASTSVGSESSELLKVMERRLLRIIMNPAMILTFVFGVWLVMITEAYKGGWFHAKFTLLLVMAGMHGYFAVTRKKFAADARPKSPKFYKIINEVVTILFIVIVLLAMLKPF